MAETRHITLSDGRKVAHREPGPDQLLDLILGVGADASMTPAWKNFETHAASAGQTDGLHLA